MRVAGWQDIQNASQGGVNPGVSPGPITAFTIGLNIGRVDEGGITPPKTVQGVVKPSRALSVPGVRIKGVHFVEIVRVPGQDAHFGPAA